MPNIPFNMLTKQNHSKSVYRGDFKNLANSCGMVRSASRVSTSGLNANRILAKQLGRNLCCNPGSDTACVNGCQ